MAKFEVFFPTLTRNEKGYVSKEAAAAKHDSGGETWNGIARAKHPDWKGWPLIDSYKPQTHNFPAILDKDHTLLQLEIEFYKAQFWDVIGGDEINNQVTANFIADWGVNAGPSVPLKHAQLILKLDNDGKIGPKTLAAINAGGADFFEELKAARIQFYKDVVEDHPDDAGELDGWINRTNSFVYA